MVDDLEEPAIDLLEKPASLDGLGWQARSCGVARLRAELVRLGDEERPKRGEVDGLAGLDRTERCEDAVDGLGIAHDSNRPAPSGAFSGPGRSIRPRESGLNPNSRTQ